MRLQGESMVLVDFTLTQKTSSYKQTQEFVLLIISAIIQWNDKKTVLLYTDHG